MTRFFTADAHLDHARIIAYESRPFANVQQMNNQLVKLWNSVVRHEDVVYILGDLSMRGREDNQGPLRHALRKMRGTKHLILGNHDKFDPFTYVDMGITSVHTSLEVEIGPRANAIDTRRYSVYLVHDPAVTRVAVGHKWLCGHVHGMFKRCGNVINVGVDVWDFKPVSEEQIVAEFHTAAAEEFSYTPEKREEWRRENTPD